MKLQKHLTRLFTLLFLVLSLTLTHSAVAQQDKSGKTDKKGLILFDFPESLEAKVEVNLTAKLINLVTKSVSNQPEVVELIQMLDGIYVRTYDRRPLMRRSWLTISSKNSKRMSGRSSSKLRKRVKRWKLIYCLTKRKFTGFSLSSSRKGLEKSLLSISSGNRARTH